jgi:3-oxoadipate enol-lactonase
MALIYLPHIRLNAEISGPAAGPPLVLLHALGTHLGIWDDLLAHLPRHRVLRVDLRGHGASDVPPPPYGMGAMIHDVEAVMAHFALRDAVVVGVSLGGLVAQGLAIKRLDLVRGVVLSNTAARIGGPSLWQARIAEVAAQGLAAYAPQAMARMFGPNWQAAPQMPRIRQMLLDTPLQGWIGAAHAVAGADFYTPLAGLHLPALVIAGGIDGSTPPDLVRETAALLPNAEFALLRGLGHLPMVQDAGAFAARLQPFLARIGHG